MEPDARPDPPAGWWLAAGGFLFLATFVVGVVHAVTASGGVFSTSLRILGAFGLACLAGIIPDFVRGAVERIRAEDP